MADFCNGHCTILLYEATCNDIKLLEIYYRKTKNKQGAKKSILQLTILASSS